MAKQTYYAALMDLVRDQVWERTNWAGDTTTQPAFVVVTVALGEFQIRAREMVESGSFTTAAGVRYRRVEG